VTGGKKAGTVVGLTEKKEHNYSLKLGSFKEAKKGERGETPLN